MKWDYKKLAQLAQCGLHDREIAKLLGVSFKAVEMARYRAGIPSYVRCTCGEVFQVAPGSTRKLSLCPACLERATALYLSSPKNAHTLVKELGTSADTLREQSVRTYGVTRRDVSPFMRTQVREVIKAHGRNRG